MSHCEVTVDGETSIVPMSWREAVYRAGKRWVGFWVLETNDAYLEETVTVNSIEGSREGSFRHIKTGKTVRWKLIGAPTLR